MAKSLKTLIRVARWAVEEKQKALGLLLEREAQIQTAIEDHHKALESERTLASSDTMGVGRGFGNYFDQWRRQLEHYKSLLTQVQEQIFAAREALAEAYREQKTVEEVQKQRDIKAALEADRKERAELDEIGLAQHLKKK